MKLNNGCDPFDKNKVQFLSLYYWTPGYTGE